MRALLLGLAGCALFVAVWSAPVHAQVTLCSGKSFAVSPGTTACSGSSNPVTVTANVKTYARLTLEEVFGGPAASLQIAMGDVDAGCVSPAGSGIRCAADYANGSATWYGDIKFRVKLTGIGGSRGKITGVRPTAGTIPAGRLLDGLAGDAPNQAYPTAPATPADLKTALANGDSLVSRSIGLRVSASDPAGAWSGQTVFSLVIE